jgi:hypothetical protein
VVAGGIFPKDEVEQQLETTTFCHEFDRNISAKIGCNPFCYYLMVLNWHCIDTIENLKKNMHKFHTFFTDIKQFFLAHGYVALTNDMMKAYKVAQV